MATLLYQEKKTKVDAGGGVDLVAQSQGRSCLYFLFLMKYETKSMRKRWDVFEVERDRNCLKSVFSKQESKCIREL